MTRAHYDHLMSMRQAIPGYTDNSYKVAQWFVSELVKRGYIDYLTVNDWSSSVPYRVYLDIPYPSRDQKVYERFDAYTLRLATAWLKARV